MLQSVKCLKIAGSNRYRPGPISGLLTKWQINHGGKSMREFNLRYARCLGAPWVDTT
jgi:hypothetical protein